MSDLSTLSKIKLDKQTNYLQVDLPDEVALWFRWEMFEIADSSVYSVLFKSELR